jgi:phage terminase large subunit-like protein
MNVLKALAAQGIAEATEADFAVQAARAALKARKASKLERYFHDCQPGCKSGSPNPSDHVPLAGNGLPTCRVLYPKHLELFRLGGQRDGRQRLFLKANRVGGTEAGAFESTLHLTGRYPGWWEGRRFEEPTLIWAAGDTGKTTRDVIQRKLVGPPEDFGSGMIPRHLIEDKSAKPGVPEAIETVWVRWHGERVGGAPAVSTVQLKSFDQRREAFQGTAVHFCWLDEECPVDIYQECLLRTAQTPDFPGGLVLLTFTPLQGLTELVLTFLPQGRIDG